MSNNKFYTYLILTENNTFYCGYTNDIDKRYEKHKNGKGAKYTKANKPVKLAYLAEYQTKSEAMKEEYRIKQLSRQEKELLSKIYLNNK